MNGDDDDVRAQHQWAPHEVSGVRRCKLVVFAGDTTNDHHHNHDDDDKSRTSSELRPHHDLRLIPNDFQTISNMFLPEENTWMVYRRNTMRVSCTIGGAKSSIIAPPSSSSPHNHDLYARVYNDNDGDDDDDRKHTSSLLPVSSLYLMVHMERDLPQTGSFTFAPVRAPTLLQKMTSAQKIEMVPPEPTMIYSSSSPLTYTSPISVEWPNLLFSNATSGNGRAAEFREYFRLVVSLVAKLDHPPSLYGRPSASSSSSGATATSTTTTTTTDDSFYYIASIRSPPLKVVGQNPSRFNAAQSSKRARHSPETPINSSPPSSSSSTSSSCSTSSSSDTSPISSPPLGTIVTSSPTTPIPAAVSAPFIPNVPPPIHSFTPIISMENQDPTLSLMYDDPILSSCSSTQHLATPNAAYGHHMPIAYDPTNYHMALTLPPSSTSTTPTFPVPSSPSLSSSVFLFNPIADPHHMHHPMLQHPASTSSIPAWNISPMSGAAVRFGSVGINVIEPSEALSVGGNILVTGNILKPSDARIKRNLVPHNNTNIALQNIRDLRIYNYERIDLSSPSNTNGSGDGSGGEVIYVPERGLLAQEVRTIIPSAVRVLGDVPLPNGDVVRDMLVVDDRMLLLETIGATQELGRKMGDISEDVDDNKRIVAKIANAVDAITKSEREVSASPSRSRLLQCCLHVNVFGLGPAWSTFLLAFFFPPLFFISSLFLFSSRRIRQISGFFSFMMCTLFVLSTIFFFLALPTRSAFYILFSVWVGHWFIGLVLFAFVSMVMACRKVVHSKHGIRILSSLRRV